MRAVRSSQSDLKSLLEDLLLCVIFFDIVVRHLLGFWLVCKLWWRGIGLEQVQQLIPRIVFWALCRFIELLLFVWCLYTWLEEVLEPRPKRKIRAPEDPYGNLIRVERWDVV